MFYEVQIPSGQGSVRTMQIQAESWCEAYRTGLGQTEGHEASPLTGAFVDIGRDRIVITDPINRLTAFVTPLDDQRVRQSQVLRVVSESSVQSAERKAPASQRQGAGPVGFKDKNTGAFRAIVSTEIHKTDTGRASGPRVVAETVAPSGRLDDSVRVEVPDAVAEQEDVSISETALEDVFLEITSLFEPNFAMEDAIDFTLDLVCKYVPCDSGGLLFAADTGDHLYFASCRGAKKKQFLKAEISIRDGLPAESLRDGMAIAVANPAEDARHTSELAEAGGIAVTSLCVAPIQSGDRAFGVLLLLNRKERSFFSQYDANILAYVGSQMGRYIQDQLDAAPLE